MRAFVTIGVDSHAELLRIALPSFEEFCDRHDYDLIIPEPLYESGRHPSWWKVPSLLAVLEEYDEALFVGSDIVIVDPTDDYPIPEGYWHSLTVHENHCGQVPNADVWYVRKPMQPVLEQMWQMTEHMHHGWWEQAALMDLMGYTLTMPCHLVEPTELYEQTWFVSNEWNVHTWCEPVEHPRFQHSTMHPDRASVMRQWAAEAAAVNT